MSLESAPVVAQEFRSGFVEAVHHGIGVITAPDGTVAFAVGDPGTPIFPRSTNKPLQAIVSRRAGMPATGELLALACSSHSGEPFHRDAVRRLLALAGLDETALQNTPALPIDEAERDRWIAAGRGPEPIAQDCSGKHSGMLTACVASGWDPATYLERDHPIQVAMVAGVEELSGERVVAIGVDGCGAPVHAYPIRGLARAYGAFAGASEGELKVIADAMRAHPAYVGGTGRDNTLLMRALPGVIAKDGADAVYAVGLPDGRGVALKITDGSKRAVGPFMAELLRVAGIQDAAALATLAASPVLGHGVPVGAVEAVRLG